MAPGGLELEFALDERMLRVVFRGAYEQSAVLAAYDRAFETAAREQRSAILVDGRQVTPPAPTTVERYDLGVHIAQLCANSRWSIRVATVATVDLLDPDRLAEVVATNRMASVRSFTTIEEAEAWLAASS